MTFFYENWGGFDLLANLNQHNTAVIDYICDAIRFWVNEFDIDGIRLDDADVIDFKYMKAIRHVANEVKPDSWLLWVKLSTAITHDGRMTEHFIP